MTTFDEDDDEYYDERDVATLSFDRGGTTFQVISTVSGFVIGENYEDGDQEYQIHNHLTGNLDEYPASELDEIVASNPTSYRTYETVGAAIDARLYPWKEER